MDYFTLEGAWWLPDSPGHRVPGALTFDADGLVLDADGSPVPTVSAPGEVLVQHGPPDWTTTPVIHGRARDGRKVTLLDAGGANLIGPKVGRSIYRPRFALVGVNVTADKFTEAWCEFDCLNAWTRPPSLVGDDSDLDRVTIRFTNLDLGEAWIGETQIRLVAKVTGDVRGNSAAVEQQAAFVIRGKSTHSRAILQEWVRPLQDLLILTLGRPVRLTALYLRPESGKQQGKLAEAWFEAIQPTPGPAPSQSSIESYTAPTLLTFTNSPLGFNELLPSWFRLRSDLLEVFVLLHGPYYAPFMFSEHRYSSTFQSAEALADARGLSGREKSRAEHLARVTAIITAAQEADVDEESVTWAQRILQSRNDKPLSQQIQELVASTGEIGRKVLAASPDFGKISTGARAGVSHGGVSSPLDSVGRQWHGDILRWIIRARVLMDLGIDAQEVESRVLQRARFQHALDQIRIAPANSRETSL